MTRKFKIINNNNFPSDKEIEEITKKVSEPNYPYKNYVLPNNASVEDRLKYEICQNIARYKRENNLSESELAEKVGESKEKIIDIICSKIYLFNLKELIKYADSLFSPLEIGIIKAEPRKNTKY